MSNDQTTDAKLIEMLTDHANYIEGDAPDWAVFAVREAIKRIKALPAVTVGVIHEEQNTEQQRIFWNWLPLAYRDGHLGEEAKFTKYNMEVAHYAGWCAALEPAAALRAIGEPRNE